MEDDFFMDFDDDVLTEAVLSRITSLVDGLRNIGGGDTVSNGPESHFLKECKLIVSILSLSGAPRKRELLGLSRRKYFCEVEVMKDRAAFPFSNSSAAPTHSRSSLIAGSCTTGPIIFAKDGSKKPHMWNLAEYYGETKIKFTIRYKTRICEKIVGSKTIRLSELLRVQAMHTSAVPINHGARAEGGSGDWGTSLTIEIPTKLTTKNFIKQQQLELARAVSAGPAAAFEVRAVNNRDDGDDDDDQDVDAEIGAAVDGTPQTDSNVRSKNAPYSKHARSTIYRSQTYRGQGFGQHSYESVPSTSSRAGPVGGAVGAGAGPGSSSHSTITSLRHNDMATDDIPNSAARLSSRGGAFRRSNSNSSSNSSGSASNSSVSSISRTDTRRSGGSIRTAASSNASATTSATAVAAAAAAAASSTGLGTGEPRSTPSLPQFLLSVTSAQSATATANTTDTAVAGCGSGLEPVTIGIASTRPGTGSSTLAPSSSLTREAGPTEIGSGIMGTRTPLSLHSTTQQSSQQQPSQPQLSQSHGLRVPTTVGFSDHPPHPPNLSETNAAGTSAGPGTVGNMRSRERDRERDRERGTHTTRFQDRERGTHIARFQGIDVGVEEDASDNGCGTDVGSNAPSDLGGGAGGAGVGVRSVSGRRGAGSRSSRTRTLPLDPSDADLAITAAPTSQRMNMSGSRCHQQQLYSSVPPSASQHFPWRREQQQQQQQQQQPQRNDDERNFAGGIRVKVRLMFRFCALQNCLHRCLPAAPLSFPEPSRAGDPHGGRTNSRVTSSAVGSRINNSSNSNSSSSRSGGGSRSMQENHEEHQEHQDDADQDRDCQSKSWTELHSLVQHAPPAVLTEVMKSLAQAHCLPRALSERTATAPFEPDRTRLGYSSSSLPPVAGGGAEGSGATVTATTTARAVGASSGAAEGTSALARVRRGPAGLGAGAGAGAGRGTIARSTVAVNVAAQRRQDPGHAPRQAQGYTPFELALYLGREHVVLDMLQRSGNLCFPGIANNTACPLHAAVRGGSLACVKLVCRFLSRHGSSVAGSVSSMPTRASNLRSHQNAFWTASFDDKLNWKDAAGFSPLALACSLRDCDVAVVEALIGMGADPAAVCPYTGYNPLMHACAAANVAAVEVLLSLQKTEQEINAGLLAVGGSNARGSASSRAVGNTPTRAGRAHRPATPTTAATAAAAAGAEPAAIGANNELDLGIFASIAGGGAGTSTDALATHLRSSARSRNILRGRDPSTGGHFNKLSLYLCEPFQRDTEDGTQAAHIAAETGCVAAVSMLIAAGISLVAVDNTGNNVFHYAARSGNLTVIRLLAEAEQQQYAAYRRLVEDGQSLHSMQFRSKAMVAHNEHGETPAAVAAERAHWDVVELIISRGETLYGQSNLEPLLRRHFQQLLELVAVQRDLQRSREKYTQQQNQGQEQGQGQQQEQQQDAATGGGKGRIAFPPECGQVKTHPSCSTSSTSKSCIQTRSSSSTKSAGVEGEYEKKEEKEKGGKGEGEQKIRGNENVGEEEEDEPAEPEFDDVADEAEFRLALSSLSTKHLHDMYGVPAYAYSLAPGPIPGPAPGPATAPLAAGTAWNDTGGKDAGKDVGEEDGTVYNVDAFTTQSQATTQEAVAVIGGEAESASALKDNVALESGASGVVSIVGSEDGSVADAKMRDSSPVLQESTVLASGASGVVSIVGSKGGSVADAKMRDSSPALQESTVLASGASGVVSIVGSEDGSVADAKMRDSSPVLQESTVARSGDLETAAQGSEEGIAPIVRAVAADTKGSLAQRDKNGLLSNEGRENKEEKGQEKEEEKEENNEEDEVMR